eukprot:TRINITY_DN2463_c0_g2_i2.p1 TRINITY_DN2463_c0_g2~~TRINITY_DN2463_c0_g2_i2.p1  ORF type:complete len:976 (-),score=219.00 TRINITY_DN2463_c0_g2_i2:4-2931(-)
MGGCSSTSSLSESSSPASSQSNPDQFRVEVDEFSDVVDLATVGKQWKGFPLVRQMTSATAPSAASTKGPSIRRTSLFSSVRFVGPRTEIGMVAAGLVRRLMELVDAVDNEPEDVPDHTWHGPQECEGDVLNWLLWSKEVLTFSSFKTTEDFVCKLCHTAAEIMQSQSTLVELRAPVKIFGDIHGQLRDLLLFFNEFGKPTVGRGGDIEVVSYVFNGDWVDRGSHQVEVMIALLALKVTYPERVWLIRGNHEDESMNLDMADVGFKVACERAFEKSQAAKVFAYFQVAFSFLPLAATVESKVLIVHGGIGDGKWRLDHLRNSVKRPLQSHNIAKDPIVQNLLWSDPVPEDRDGEESDGPNATFGVHESHRGHAAIKSFGADVTRRFCEINRLEMIVRSHQCTKHGYGYTLMHQGRLMRVFSARHYDNTQGNAASMLLLGYKRPRPKADEPRTLVIRAKVIRPPPHALQCPSLREPTAQLVSKASFKSLRHVSKESIAVDLLPLVEVDEECDVVNKSVDRVHCHGHAQQVWASTDGAQQLNRAAVVGQPVLCADRFVTTPGEVGEVAGALIARAMELVDAVGAELTDVHANGWTGSAECDGDVLKWLLAPILESYETLEDGIQDMCAHAKDIFLRQDVLVELRAPVKIFGEFRGQLRDLFVFFHQFGRPTVGRGGDIEMISYAFTGGFVGNGRHQVEITVLLLALKLVYGERVWLLRGAPEAARADRSNPTGFLAACERCFRRGQFVYDCFQDVFQCLPMAATVEGRVLVIHGGIGHGEWNVEDLRCQTNAPISSSDLKKDPLKRSLLWSEPDGTQSSDDLTARRRTSTKVETFSKAATLAFCERNSLGLVVCSRSGALPDGYMLMHAGRMMHIFSARSFGERPGDAGAMVVVAYKRPHATGDRGVIVRAKVIKATENAVLPSPTKEGWCAPFLRAVNQRLSTGCLGFLNGAKGAQSAKVASGGDATRKRTRAAAAK